MTNGEGEAAGQWKRPQILKIVIAAVAAALLGWTVVETAAVNALVDEDIGAAAFFSPGDPRIALRWADSEVRRKQGDVSRAALDRSLEASLRAPLTETPFLLAGARALRAGDGDKAEKLLLEARQRNPRSRAARFLLLERYVRTGRATEAAAEIAVLSRLMPDARPILIAGLARLAASFDESPAIAQVLRSDPRIQQDVLEHLAVSRAAPSLVVALAEGTAPSIGAQWPRYVIGALVEQGDIAPAYAQWRRLSALPEGAVPTGLFNGRFEALPALPPFNWRFATDKAGTATPGAGLRISYKGGAQLRLAEQLLQLPAGPYSLTFEAEGDIFGKSGSLAWRIACHSSDRPLASIPVNASAQIAASNEAAFVVPENCPAQWIALVGMPGERPETLEVTLSNLAINRSDPM